MKSFLTLDKLGIISALLIGILLILLGESLWWYFLILMLIFLVFSALVTKFKKKQKIAYGIYEGSRSWENVLANGSIPLFIVLLYALSGYLGINSTFLVFAYASSIAAITADKFSSEIGVLQRKAVMIFSMKKVNAGTSGGVSTLGFFAGFIGSLLIGIVAYLITGNILFLVITTVSGFFGDIIDSIFGYYEEQGVGNKFSTNMLCAISAALLAMFLLYL